MRKIVINALLAASVVVLLGVSFFVGQANTDPDERFAGADALATAQIQQLAPDYRPWFEPFFQPESAEVESGLFALQAAIGGVVLGFALGGLWGRRRAERDAASPAL